MRVGGRASRREDDVARRDGADMAQITQHPAAVHLAPPRVPKAAEPGVARLVTAGAGEVLRIVGDLRDADAELLEQLDIVDPVLEPRSVLEAENDPGSAFHFGAANVGGGPHRRYQVGILGEPALPLRN